MLEARARSMRARLVSINEPLLRFPATVARERERLRATAATLGAVSRCRSSRAATPSPSPRTKRGRRKPIMDSKAVNVGDAIEVQLKRGAMQCTVDAKTLGIESVWPESRPIRDAPDAQKLGDTGLNGRKEIVCSAARGQPNMLGIAVLCQEAERYAIVLPDQ